MISPAALLLGLAVAAPSLWGALVNGTIAVDVALQRTVLILAASAVAWGVFQSLLDGFARSANRRSAARTRVRTEARRRDDH